MSFRLEDKYIVNNEDKIKILSFIEKSDFEQEFKNRDITSIYFDDKNLRMFHDSEEGSTPRKKIRVRFYEDKNKNLNLEKKINSQEGKFKITKKINFNDLNNYKKNGYYDSTYGICYPVLKVNYNRYYFKKKDYRITFDININFKDTNNENFRYLENFSVLEVKILNKFNIPLELEQLPLNKIRYSKYSEGIKKIYDRIDKNRIYF
ncbi:VTC domain-containing protein [Candidatus Pelagibacter communis]|uniref:VTC domain-containing protein n=1 Tax=Pelagibacter ubique TaxID=198252 RepID=UPI00094D4442|nr:VTC domain-containing protein [Candidatus Pelagibacter ubique]